MFLENVINLVIFGDAPLNVDDDEEYIPVVRKLHPFMEDEELLHKVLEEHKKLGLVWTIVYLNTGAMYRQGFKIHPWYIWSQRTTSMEMCQTFIVLQCYYSWIFMEGHEQDAKCVDM